MKIIAVAWFVLIVSGCISHPNPWVPTEDVADAGKDSRAADGQVDVGSGDVNQNDDVVDVGDVQDMKDQVDPDDVIEEIADGIDTSEPDICVPDCDEKECGDDGCGGSCGECCVGTSCESGKCGPPECPNGSCDEGETCCNFPADCGSCCGNGKCDCNENCEVCALDCDCPAQCQLTLAPINQHLHFNSVSPGDIKEKPVVLINTGKAPCTISHVAVTDKWGSASEDYALKQIFQDGSSVPASSLLTVWVQYSPHSSDPVGRLTVEYIDADVGPMELIVKLDGSKEAACKIPVAVPGMYEGVAAGKIVNLTGYGSAAGDCGEAIEDQSYTWFLLAKPADSVVQFNTAGNCHAAFIPDLPGTYEVGLLVYDAWYFQSDLATATIEVSAE